MSLIVITPPLAEPVTLAEVRTHTRLDSIADDTALAGYIIAAREICEHELQRSLIARTYELLLDAFPQGSIELPMAPIPAQSALSVTSVKYDDPASIEQTMSAAAYTLDPYSDVPRIEAVSGWPPAKAAINAVRVRYVSGHASALLIPQSIKTWILLHVGHYYENREAMSEAVLQPLPNLGRLLDPYRTFR
jgi:uncharacterized phiE125 gp8 family phage protein